MRRERTRTRRATQQQASLDATRRDATRESERCEMSEEMQVKHETHQQTDACAQATTLGVASSRVASPRSKRKQRNATHAEWRRETRGERRRGGGEQRAGRKRGLGHEYLRRVRAARTGQRARARAPHRHRHAHRHRARTCARTTRSHSRTALYLQAAPDTHTHIQTYEYVHANTQIRQTSCMRSCTTHMTGTVYGIAMYDVVT